MNIKEVVLNKYKNNKELSKSFIWRLLQVLSKQGTSAFMFFIATFFLTVEDMGIYNYMTAILLLLVIFSDFGISTSTSRYVALYNVSHKEKVQKIFFNSLLLITGASIFIVLSVLVLNKYYPLKYFEYIQYILPLVLISPLSSLLDGIYRGLKKFKKLSSLSIANSVVGILSSLIFVYLFGLKGAIIAQSVYYLSYSILLMIFFKGYKFRVDRGILFDVGKYSISFGIATLGFYFFSKVNILILGRYDLLEEIAVYELLNKGFALFLIPFVVLGQVLAPYVVDMYAKKKILELRSLFYKLLKWLLVLGMPYILISSVITVFGIQFLLPLYMGEILTSILLPVALTYLIAIPVVVINAGLLTSTGHANYMAIQNVISGILNVVLNLLVVRRFGYVGVVWVTFGIQILSTMVLYWVYNSYLLKKT